MNLRITTRGIGAAATAETQHRAPTGGSRRGETGTFGPNHLVVDTCLRPMPCIYSTFTMTQIRPRFSFPIGRRLLNGRRGVGFAFSTAGNGQLRCVPHPAAAPDYFPNTKTRFSFKVIIPTQGFLWNSEIKVFDDTTTPNTSYHWTSAAKTKTDFVHLTSFVVLPGSWLAVSSSH